jgi:hypothetical protein
MRTQTATELITTMTRSPSPSAWKPCYDVLLPKLRRNPATPHVQASHLYQHPPALSHRLRRQLANIAATTLHHVDNVEKNIQAYMDLGTFLGTLPRNTKTRIGSRVGLQDAPRYTGDKTPGKSTFEISTRSYSPLWFNDKALV